MGPDMKPSQATRVHVARFDQSEQLGCEPTRRLPCGSSKCEIMKHAKVYLDVRDERRTNVQE